MLQEGYIQEIQNSSPRGPEVDTCGVGWNHSLSSQYPFLQVKSISTNTLTDRPAQDSSPQMKPWKENKNNDYYYDYKLIG